MEYKAVAINLEGGGGAGRGEQGRGKKEGLACDGLPSHKMKVMKVMALHLPSCMKWYRKF